jgi:CRP/FNR family transcriptional regulator, cyclic AMP receptor protein
LAVGEKQIANGGGRYDSQSGSITYVTNDSLFPFVQLLSDHSWINSCASLPGAEIKRTADLTLLSTSDFVGEEALAAIAGVRLETATAITACTLLKISRQEMIHVMHEEHSFSDLFLKFMLKRSMRIQADLVDQLFNSGKKRLARILLLMAKFGKPGKLEQYIPPITQETLAEMIGTTRSRVGFFMNRFRKLGFIEYKDRIRVHKSLLDVVLHDQPPQDNSERSPIDRRSR